MAVDKKAFVVYVDWESQFDLLSDEEAGKLIKHIFSYVNDKNPHFEPTERLLTIAFEPIKKQLKRDLKKYENIKQKRAEAGKRGGQKSGEARQRNEVNEANASFANQTEANEAVTVTDIVKDTVTVKDTVIDKDISINSISAENEFSSTQTKKNIDDRLEKFRLQIEPFREKYSSETLNDFWRYWTEKNENGKKMRFEMQKVFDVGRRLITWSKNENKNFNGKAKSIGTTQSRQERVDEVRELRKSNQQALASELQKYIGGDP